MDQCVVMGPGAVGLMKFDSDHCSLRRLTLPASASSPTSTSAHAEASSKSSEPSEQKGGLFFVVVDLKASKNTVVILHELNECFPHPRNETQVQAHVIYLSSCSIISSSPPLLSSLISFWRIYHVAGFDLQLC